MNITELEKRLSQPLDQARIKTRKGPNGQQLSYIEGWDVIEALNENFGFLGWSRETLMLERLHDPVLITDADSPEKGKVVAAYRAKVRITVYAGERTILREGSAAARSFARTASEAEEQAIKSAETDAMKRAAVTFGNQFGLALYDKSHKNVGREERPSGQARGRAQIAQGRERPMAPLDEGFDGEPSRAPTTSERALAVAGKPAAKSYANGGSMRY
jgi:recombination DNA repair RAD52 pathway protein